MPALRTEWFANKWRSKINKCQFVQDVHSHTSQIHLKTLHPEVDNGAFGLNLLDFTVVLQLKYQLLTLGGVLTQCTMLVVSLVEEIMRWDYFTVTLPAQNPKVSVPELQQAAQGYLRTFYCSYRHLQDENKNFPMEFCSVVLPKMAMPFIESLP